MDSILVTDDVSKFDKSIDSMLKAWLSSAGSKKFPRAFGGLLKWISI